jgi:hypothetical protein
MARRLIIHSAKAAMLAGVAAGALFLASGDIVHAQGQGQGGGGSESSGGGGGNSDSGSGGGGGNSDSGSGGGGGNSDSGSGGSGGGSSSSGGSGGSSSGGSSSGGGSSNQGGSDGAAGSGGQSGASGQGGRPSDGPSDEADEDSDRPAWAGGNPEMNPHAGAGTGNPSSGTTKGDLYGDLVVLLRDLATGEPIVAGTSVDPETGEEITEYYVCLDADCTTTVSTVLGEIPEGVTAIEVEFGRSSVARAPDKVTDQALDEALSKLSDAEEVALDVSGRIVYSIDGAWYTIDSPLENLALYIDLATGLAADLTTPTEAALDALGLATLDTAASMLAGLADKTGDITLDYLVNENVIAGVVEAGDYYDYTDFAYTRDYPTDYTYWVSIDGALPVTATLDINAYLTDASVNGELPDAADYAALFAAAADDALEVIELVHTQIYTEILPGTIVE